MKKIIFAILIIISVLLACNPTTENNNNKTDITQTGELQETQKHNLKLQIYYFHATNRCPTCNSIEANLKKVLEDHYKELLSKGIIDFKVLCVDEPENKFLVEKYEAAGAALHLVKIGNGNEEDHDLTEYAFSYSRTNPDIFLKGMQDTISYLIQ